MHNQSDNNYVSSYGNNESKELTLIQLLIGMMRYRRFLFSCIFLGAILSIGFALIRPNKFTSESSFVHHGNSTNGSRLAGVVAQFGFTVGGEGRVSLAFYSVLLKSRGILESVAQSEYSIRAKGARGDSLSGTLISILDVRGDTSDEKLRKTVSMLSDQVDISMNAEAGILHIKVSASWPDLAEQVNRRLFDKINEFNLSGRQSRASEERQFIEGRLNEAKKELEEVETEIQKFYEENRQVNSSPALQSEVAHLTRRVEHRQQIYLILAQSFEQARIDEVRDTPVLTLVDAPEGSARGNRSLLKSAIIGILLSGFLALGLMSIRGYILHERKVNPSDYAQFKALRQDTWIDLNVIKHFKKGD